MAFIFGNSYLLTSVSGSGKSHFVNSFLFNKHTAVQKLFIPQTYQRIIFFFKHIKDQESYHITEHDIETEKVICLEHDDFNNEYLNTSLIPQTIIIIEDLDIALFRTREDTLLTLLNYTTNHLNCLTFIITQNITNSICRNLLHHCSAIITQPKLMTNRKLVNRLYASILDKTETDNLRTLNSSFGNLWPEKFIIYLSNPSAITQALLGSIKLVIPFIDLSLCIGFELATSHIKSSIPHSINIVTLNGQKMTELQHRFLKQLQGQSSVQSYLIIPTQNIVVKDVPIKENRRNNKTQEEQDFIRAQDAIFGKIMYNIPTQNQFKAKTYVRYIFSSPNIQLVDDIYLRLVDNQRHPKVKLFGLLVCMTKRSSNFDDETKKKQMRKMYLPFIRALLQSSDLVVENLTNKNLIP